MDLTEEEQAALDHLKDLHAWFSETTTGLLLTPNTQATGILVTTAGMAYRLIRGIISQGEGGSNDCVSSHLRSLLEATLNMCYIFVEPSTIADRAEAYLYYTEREELKGVRRIRDLMKQHKLAAMSAFCTVADLDKKEAEMVAHLATLTPNDKWPPNIEQLANTLKAHGEYAIGYYWFSRQVHMQLSAATGLLSQTGDAIEYNAEVETSNLLGEIKTASVVFVELCRLLQQNTNLPPLPEPRFSWVSTLTL